MPLVARKPSQGLVDLVGTLGGRWRGYTAICRCPAHTDRTPSLTLRQGDRSIIVHCFAGCHAADVLRELRRVRPTGRFDLPQSTLGSGEANVARLWDDAREIAGTLAETYLASRRLPPDLPDLRFLPRCPQGPKPTTQFKPALLVAVRESRCLLAVQRIFLDPGTGRYTGKLMLGQPRGGAWQGGPAADTLAIAEGFEDAAAFTILTGTPCWAALGAARLPKLSIPASVRELVIAEDNDAEGRLAARRAWSAYRNAARRLRRASPRPHGDWAEALMDR